MNQETKCSFCGKAEHKVAMMLTNGKGVICNECIRVSRAVLSVENLAKVIPFPNVFVTG